ncbi:hypothetical protein Tco_0028965, partial [Tanacetum coccineum]
CVTSNVESPKVFVFEKYAIEVESIPLSQRNNRDVHHHYLNRLRDTLDTLCKIVEEARSKRPSDHSLDYARVYTKRSQELLENVSASCPKACNNTTNHVKHPTVQKTNVPIIHSTECPLTRNTKPKVVPVKQWKPTSRLIPLGGQCPLVRPTALNRGRTDRTLVFGLRLLKTYDWRLLTAQEFREKVYRDCQIWKRSF